MKLNALTVGTGPRSTFVIPDLGLPDRYAIVKPGNRGYLLTLGESMRGTLNIDGSPRDVEEFVRRGGEGEAGDSCRFGHWGCSSLHRSAGARRLR